VALAQVDPGYCVHWVDQNLPPGTANPMDNDRARIILNVATTGDTATLERTLRTVWGGSLCVSRGVRTNAEMAQIQDAVQSIPGWLTCGRDGRQGRVDLHVVRATRQLQAHLDTAYGPGTVNLTGALTPLGLTTQRPSG
jgi:hypothetical protein